MKYIESITSFFDNPKWVMNLLFGAICMLIPIVGPIVLMGWLITILWAPKTVHMPTAAPFDFGKFGFYLERGLWPFLVALVTGIGLGIVGGILGLIPTAIVGFVFGNRGFGALLGTGISMLVWFVVIAVMIFALIPLLVRAILVQDFAKAFDIAWVKRFVSMMWMEMLMTALFAWLAGIALSIVGFIALCVGIYAAAALLQFMSFNLYRQLYDLYLSRGGEAIPPSPKLMEAPASEMVPPPAV